MLKVRLGILVAIALPLVPLVACNGGSQSSDPTDPTPIIGCGVNTLCRLPLPPTPCLGGVAGADQLCHPWPTPTPTPLPTACPLTAGGCGPLPTPTFRPLPLPTFTPLPDPTPVSSGGIASSQGQGTKDTGLEQSEFQQNLMTAQAQTLVNRFAMSLSAATQLAELAGRIQAMANEGNGQLTDADRQAITGSALSIVGVTSDQVNSAITAEQAGDDSQTEALLETAAKNLGMSSSATLRDQLLPALGLTLN